jgi:cobaltochelatase CobS
MPRTPSMTVAEAEAAIGPASQLIVDGPKRALLRKWAVAKFKGVAGYDSHIIYRMTAVDLANLYAAYGLGGTGVMPTPVVPVAPAIPAPAPTAKQHDAAEQFTRLIQQMANGSLVNETQVREIAANVVADALSNFTPEPTVSRLIVQTPTATNVIDGIVHEATPKVIRVAALGHPIMLVGPAGCGKTHIAGNVAVALGLPLYITSTVLDTHELMGFVDGYGKYHTTAFRHAFEHGGIWVADEIDAWDAAALLAANSALANGLATFPDSDTPVHRHANFRVIATANTYGHGADRVYVGRNELDAASTDRFCIIEVDYDVRLELAVCGGNVDWMNRVQSIRASVRAKGIRHVVSTRAIIMGSQALSVGFDQEEVETMYVFKGMSKADRAKI